MIFLILVHQAILNSFFAQELSLLSLRQYLNVSNVTNTDRYLCQQNNASTKNCDNNCFHSESCCIHKLWNNTNSPTLDVYLEMFVNTSKSYKNLVCEQVMPAAIENEEHKREEILMVHSCPNGTKKSDIELCINSNDKSVIGNIPVMESDNLADRIAICAHCSIVAVAIAMNMSLEYHNEIEKTTVIIIIVEEGTESATTTVATVTNNTITPTIILTTTNALKVNEILDQHQVCTVLLSRKNETKDTVVSCFSQEFVKDKNCQKCSMQCDLCHMYPGDLSICNSCNCSNCKNDIIIDHTEPPPPSNTKNMWKKTFSTLDDPSTSCKEESFYNFLTNTCEQMSCCYGYKVVGSQCLEVQKTSPIKISKMQALKTA